MLLFLGIVKITTYQDLINYVSRFENAPPNLWPNSSDQRFQRGDKVEAKVTSMARSNGKMVDANTNTSNNDNSSNKNDSSSDNKPVYGSGQPTKTLNELKNKPYSFGQPQLLVVGI